MKRSKNVIQWKQCFRWPFCSEVFWLHSCVHASPHSVLVSLQAWARTEGGLIRTMASHVSNLFQKTRETRQAQTHQKPYSKNHTCFKLLDTTIQEIVGTNFWKLLYLFHSLSYNPGNYYLTFWSYERWYPLFPAGPGRAMKIWMCWSPLFWWSWRHDWLGGWVFLSATHLDQKSGSEIWIRNVWMFFHGINNISKAYSIVW